MISNPLRAQITLIPTGKGCKRTVLARNCFISWLGKFVAKDYLLGKQVKWLLAGTFLSKHASWQSRMDISFPALSEIEKQVVHTISDEMRIF